MTRLRRSQAGPTYDAAVIARPLFGAARRALPLWLWQLFPGAYVAFRAGAWSRDRGVAFGRVLGNSIVQGLVRAEESPRFSAEVWFPSDPLEAGKIQLEESIRNGYVLRYVSEHEALTLRTFLPAWFAGAEPQPLSPELLRAILGGTAP